MRKYLFVYTNGISIKNETVITYSKLGETITWFKGNHKDDKECVIINIINLTNE